MILGEVVHAEFERFAGVEPMLSAVLLFGALSAVDPKARRNVRFRESKNTVICGAQVCLKWRITVLINAGRIFRGFVK
jgi:hypothetical protein